MFDTTHSLDQFKQRYKESEISRDYYSSGEPDYVADGRRVILHGANESSAWRGGNNEENLKKTILYWRQGLKNFIDEITRLDKERFSPFKQIISNMDQFTDFQIGKMHDAIKCQLNEIKKNYKKAKKVPDFPKEYAYLYFWSLIRCFSSTNQELLAATVSIAIKDLIVQYVESKSAISSDQKAATALRLYNSVAYKFSLSCIDEAPFFIPDFFNSRLSIQRERPGDVFMEPEVLAATLAVFGVRERDPFEGVITEEKVFTRVMNDLLEEYRPLFHPQKKIINTMQAASSHIALPHLALPYSPAVEFKIESLSEEEREMALYCYVFIKYGFQDKYVVLAEDHYFFFFDEGNYVVQAGQFRKAGYKDIALLLIQNGEGVFRQLGHGFACWIFPVLLKKGFLNETEHQWLFSPLLYSVGNEKLFRSIQNSFDVKSVLTNIHSPQLRSVILRNLTPRINEILGNVYSLNAYDDEVDAELNRKTDIQDKIVSTKNRMFKISIGESLNNLLFALNEQEFNEALACIEGIPALFETTQDFARAVSNLEEYKVRKIYEMSESHLLSINGDSLDNAAVVLNVLPQDLRRAYWDKVIPENIERDYKYLVTVLACLGEDNDIYVDCKRNVLTIILNYPEPLQALMAVLSYLSKGEGEGLLREMVESGRLSNVIDSIENFVCFLSSFMIDPEKRSAFFNISRPVLSELIVTKIHDENLDVLLNSLLPEQIRALFSDAVAGEKLLSICFLPKNFIHLLSSLDQERINFLIEISKNREDGCLADFENTQQIREFLDAIDFSRFSELIGDKEKKKILSLLLSAQDAYHLLDFENDKQNKIKFLLPIIRNKFNSLWKKTSDLILVLAHLDQGDRHAVFKTALVKLDQLIPNQDSLTLILSLWQNEISHHESDKLDRELVKESKNLTMAEKFLLFLLSDYRGFDKKFTPEMIYQMIGMENALTVKKEKEIMQTVNEPIIEEPDEEADKSLSDSYLLVLRHESSFSSSSKPSEAGIFSRWFGGRNRSNTHPSSTHGSSSVSAPYSNRL